ncbi:hypothetical protein ABPG74_007916 [Tetrahymena malaccensis]
MGDLILKKNSKQYKKEKLKKVQYGFILVKDIESEHVYQIVGEITVDIKQLIDRDYVNTISTWNNYVKIKELKRLNSSKFVEIYFDQDFKIRDDIKIPIKLLKNTQQKHLYEIAKLIEEFKKKLKIRKQQDNQQYQQQKQLIIQNLHDQLKPLNELDCDELHGWNFEKSAAKADKVINELNQSMLFQDDFYFYTLLRGGKYDQSKYRIGYSTYVLRYFWGLSDEQVFYLLQRKPIHFSFKFNHQHTSFLINRLQSSIRLLNKQNSNLDQFRYGPKFLREFEQDVYSIDNLCVKVVQTEQLYVLSNYKYQIDDILIIGKWKSIRGQPVQEVLMGMRQLKNDLIQDKQNTDFNQFFNGQIYSDLIYGAQSEIFKEKFYTIVENNKYHDILENL